VLQQPSAGKCGAKCPEGIYAYLPGFSFAHDACQADDRQTGRSKRFSFVEMGSDQEAQAAIQGLG
jgi:hypothetical protein